MLEITINPNTAVKVKKQERQISNLLYLKSASISWNEGTFQFESTIPLSSPKIYRRLKKLQEKEMEQYVNDVFSEYIASLLSN